MKATYQPLDQTTARNAFKGTSFDPEKRGDSQIQYHKDTFDELQNELGDFFEQKHADKLRELWMKYLHSHSSVMSSMIVGPARFPVERNRKRSDWAENHWRAIFEYCDNLRKWKRKADKRQAVEAAGGELAMKRAELEASKKWHETMKAANVIIRKALKAGGITEETREALCGLGIERSEVEKISVPNCFGGYGYESYSLNNSNARIKVQAARISKMESIEAAKENGVEPDVFEIPGGKVFYDYASNRINVKHDEKPERAIIDQIKARGFRWSRQYGTWTRKMTNNAKWSAENLIKALNAEAVEA